MPKLVLLQGASGTGKTSVAYYLKDNFGFRHLGLDVFIERFRKVTDPQGSYIFESSKCVL